MTDLLIQHLQQYVNFTPSEIEHIKSLFQVKSFKKKQVLLRAGQVCHYLNYVYSGSVKVYSVKNNGVESIIYFALEDWWAADLQSLLTGKTSKFSIQVLEDTTVIQICRDELLIALEEIPNLEKCFRMILQRVASLYETRIDFVLSLTAVEKYQAFVTKYPTIETRISQKDVAAYLGITPVFLSKLKSKNRTLKLY